MNSNYLFGKHRVTIGKSHPLVSSSKSLFSLLNKPQIYTQLTKLAEIIDPTKYSNLSKLLEKYGFLKNIISITQKNRVKNRGYWELLYLDASTNIWYDYASEPMSIQNIDAANYIVEQPSYVAAILENDQRFEYYDEAYVITDNIATTENFPATKEYSFKNNPNLTSTLKLIATLSALDPNPYVERTVNRTSCFVFAPGTTCYLLIYYNPNEGEKKVYCMQTWTNSVHTELDPTTNMCYLNTYLKESPNVSQPLPEYWTFAQCLLDDETMIALFSNPSMGISARVISDGISNSYQYVRPEEAPFLYE